jgi:flagellar hook-basal body complex protein FliE
MSVLPPISGVSGIASSTGASRLNAPRTTQSFGQTVADGLDAVADMEKKADSLVAGLAAGGNVQIADVMAATTKANLGMAIVNEIRTKGLEAYQSIINVQV